MIEELISKWKKIKEDKVWSIWAYWSSIYYEVAPMVLEDLESLQSTKQKRVCPECWLDKDYCSCAVAYEAKQEEVEIKMLKHLCSKFKQSERIEAMMLIELEHIKKQIERNWCYNILRLQSDICRIIDDKTKSSKWLYEWIKQNL